MSDLMGWGIEDDIRLEAGITRIRSEREDQTGRVALVDDDDQGMA
jgi:hypothetical protein